MDKDIGRVEYGDFQSPDVLAEQVCDLLGRLGVDPSSILEPTCGQGSLLIAAAKRFAVEHAMGVEVRPSYVEIAREKAEERGAQNVRIEVGDFFQIDWKQVLADLIDPVLIIGNPPWVTNSGVSAIQGANVPTKNNFQGHKGLDAITGKANFDISEWMMIQLLEACNGRDTTIAMLLKTAVARKSLSHAWKRGLQISYASMYGIDAKKHFDASVAACLLTVRFSPSSFTTECEVFDSLNSDKPQQTIGYHDSMLIADVDAFRRTCDLAKPTAYKWRSGIKHDCSKIMEFKQTDCGLLNGLGEPVTIEDDYLFPMLKTSDVANGRLKPKRWMLVPQRTTGQETAEIKHRAPKTWDYLQQHGNLLDRRGSSIYRKRPRFSVFGIGAYSFTDWKVAISGFYRSLNFQLVGPYKSKPVVFDDASYFLSCKSQEEATHLWRMLSSPEAQDFFRAFIFWDSKRPITTELLHRLSIESLADCLGEADRLPRREIETSSKRGRPRKAAAETGKLF